MNQNAPSLFSNDLQALNNALFAFARKRVQSEDDILDLIQDTLTEYLANREKFRNASSELTYLTGILRNKIFELYRRQGRELTPGHETIDAMLDSGTSLHSQYVSSDAVHEKLASDDVTHRIQKCIRRLKPPYFQAFVLREVEELKTDEICKIMGVSITNLNVILHRARKQLQLMLKAEGIKDASSGLT